MKLQGVLFKPDETRICAERAKTPINLHVDCVNSIMHVETNREG